METIAQQLQQLSITNNSNSTLPKTRTALSDFIQTLIQLKIPLENAHLEQKLLIDTTSRLNHPDVENSDGQTCLHIAAKQRNGDLLRRELQDGYTRDVNVADYRGNSPLHLLLSSKNFDENDDEDLVDLARILLSCGADVDAKNDEGKTPLHAAVACGSLKLTELLLAYGADVQSYDNKGFGVLHYLAGTPRNSSVCRDLLQLLLNFDCDINARSQHGRTPIYVAVCTGHDVCFDLLIEHGANFRYRDLKFDTTILHIAVKYAKEYVVKRLMEILSKGDPCEKNAMINARQKDGRTALHLSTRHKLTSILNLLLRHRADVDCRDCFGRTALHYACEYRNVNAFDELIPFGADLGVEDNKGLTPMKLSGDFVEAMIWLRVVTINAKSMAVGLPVVDFRTNLMQMLHTIKSYDRYNVEVMRMKQTMINSRISVYDLLLSEEMMYRYKNNVVLRETIHFGKLFPSYKEMLVGKYRRAGMRRYLVALAAKALWRMTGYKIESELTDMIFEKLSNEELHGFVEAAVMEDQD